MVGLTLLPDLGAYLLVTWADGVTLEADGVLPDDMGALAVLVETANEQATIHAREEATC